MSLVYQINRDFMRLATISIHDAKGKKQKLQIEAFFRELSIDRSKEIADEAESSILEEALVSVKPVNFELQDREGRVITDPDLIKEAVLNNVTLAKGCMDAYWEETIKKKE